MSRAGLWIPLLALASLFFGWRAYDAWTRPAGAVGIPQQRPATPIGVAQEEAPPAPDLSTPVVSIVSRPVFRPDRKPFREEVAAVPKRNYEAELARFTLLGVLLQGADKKGVVVGKGAAGRDERWEVGPGDSLPGFTVKDIGADGMTLAADDREFLLPLYAGGPKAQPGRGPVRTETGPPTPAAPATQPASPPAAGGAPGGTPPARPSPPAAATPVTPAPPAAVAPPSTPLSPGGLPPDYYRRRPRYIPGRR